MSKQHSCLNCLSGPRIVACDRLMKPRAVGWSAGCRIQMLLHTVSTISDHIKRSFTDNE